MFWQAIPFPEHESPLWPLGNHSFILDVWEPLPAACGLSTGLPAGVD